MATDENKALLRRFIDLWSTGNVALADEFVRTDLLDHTLLPGLPPGLAGFKLMVRGYRAAFPDLRVTIDDLLAQGDKAAARVTFRGTQRGEFQDIPPTGKSITMSAIALLRFKDGAVVEQWAVLDRLSMLTQVGVAPAQHTAAYETLWPARPSGRSRQAADPAANLALVRRFFEDVYNGRRLEVADALFAANHRYHDPSIPGVADGPAGIRQTPGPVVPYQQAFSDARWHIEDMLAEGDTVVTRWRGNGTQDGDLPGIPATGRQVEVSGVWLQRITDGTIVESWHVWDALGMLQQLGIIADPKEIAR
jgi:steroid delta-isomerase-like uncharacterized protein